MNLNRFIPLIMLMSIGCTSFRTTIMQRATDGRFYMNCPKPKTTGVPVKLKVPTHVQVEIIESYFVVARDDKDTGNSTYFEAGIELEGKPLRAMTVNTSIVYTDKVFTVDFRRPAGGVLNLTGATMDSDQYFKSIQANYEEQTLSQISAALTTLKTGTPNTSFNADSTRLVSMGKDTAPSQTSRQASAGTRTVALARFDVSDADWEEQLNCFVERHVTGCYDDCNYQK